MPHCASNFLIENDEIMIKADVIAALRAQLQSQYDRMLAAAREARGYATDQDSKAESKYDTRSLEASYLAVGQAAKADELAVALDTFRPESFRDFAEIEPIDLGALVEVVYPDRAKATFLLAPHGGGMMIDLDGVTVMVITPGAPVFGKLAGKRADDELADPPMKIARVS
ncbi:MAG: hypothetical protein KDN19_00260 [Verrucomicrobiae bacterium]|nr:hypothetical protein [Verrucomicrobiae bacterium]